MEENVKKKLKEERKNRKDAIVGRYGKENMEEKKCYRQTDIRDNWMGVWRNES